MNKKMYLLFNYRIINILEKCEFCLLHPEILPNHSFLKLVHAPIYQHGAYSELHENK